MYGSSLCGNKLACRFVNWVETSEGGLGGFLYVCVAFLGLKFCYVDSWNCESNFSKMICLSLLIGIFEDSSKNVFYLVLLLISQIELLSNHIQISNFGKLTKYHT